MTRLDSGIVVADTLSQAWLETTKDTRDAGGDAFHTLTRITNPLTEDPAIRDGYDALLRGLDHPSADTVASTIFPLAMADRSNSPDELVERYRRAYPALRRFGPNKKGIYFGRIVAYPSPGGDRDQLVPLIRKLKAELNTSGPMSARYEVGIGTVGDLDDESGESGTEVHAEAGGGSAGTSVAVPIFAPHKDTSRRSFPCLSMVSFQLDDSRLHLFAQYRYEYLVEKGYGNYLGLAHLLAYVAQAVSLQPGQMTVAAGRIKADASARALKHYLGDAWTQA